MSWFKKKTVSELTTKEVVGLANEIRHYEDRIRNKDIELTALRQKCQALEISLRDATNKLNKIRGDLC